jgi:hypothetical protein
MKVITEWFTPRDLARMVKEELGEKVVIKEVDEEKWKALRNELPNFEGLWRNIDWFYQNYPQYHGGTIEFSKSLVPHATTAREYIRSLGNSLISA